VLSTICLDVNRKAHMACNFNYLFENDGTSEGHKQSCTL